MPELAYKDGKARYGNNLLFGAMGVVEEGVDQFRLIHYGTHTIPIDSFIRARDHIQGPLVGDLVAELLDPEERDNKQLGLVWDLASAHRACQDHPDDWGAFRPAHLRTSETRLPARTWRCSLTP